MMLSLALCDALGVSGRLYDALRGSLCGSVRLAGVLSDAL